MMGPWEVSSNVLGVRTFYSVCRRCGKRAVIYYFSPLLVLIRCDRSPAERRNLRFCSDISGDTLQDAEAAWRRLQHEVEL